MDQPFTIAEYHCLQRAGFSEQEIARLLEFRCTFRLTEQDQAVLDPMLLGLVRWLYVHGKLTDQIS